jgi:dienelactone hydrolase
VSAFVLACSLWAAAPARAVEELRTIHTRDLNTHREFRGYASLAEWEAWAGYLRRHILVSTGLWPTPKRCPLGAQVFGRIERAGYSVEKVYFQSYPGFYCTGNLYRPLGKQGPFPGVLSPHGHWAVGRLANEELGSVPGRCINLARQGYVVFTHDMVGYNDSKQVSHQFQGQREELWGQNLMGLQLWNSIRAIDFLQSLPDVDPKRIGCTGESGGGTQTFMLMGVEPRLTAAVPAVMVSAYMQGGCLCENAPNLRVDTFNTEIAALMAPRPLLLISATGDWTAHNPTEEYPDIKSVYALYGAEDKVACVQFDAPHNYNLASREAMYAFFGKWLLGVTEQETLREKPFEVEKNEDLLVWAGRKLPAGAVTQAQLTENLIQASEAQLGAARPTDRKTLRQFRELYGSSLAHALNLRPARELQVRETAQVVITTDPYYMEDLTLAGATAETRIPVTLLAPAKPRRSQATVVIVSDRPRKSLLEAGGHQPGPMVRALLDRGRQVLLVDAFLIGDDQLSPESDRRPEVEFFDTYNRTDLALRVQDIVMALLYMKQCGGGGPVSLVGLGEAGLWCLLASPASPTLTAVAADLARLDASSDDELMKRLFTPGLRRAGDLRTAGALWAPTRLLFHNAGSGHGLDFVEAAYAAARAAGKLRVMEEPAGVDDLVKWVAPRKP